MPLEDEFAIFPVGSSDVNYNPIPQELQRLLAQGITIDVMLLNLLQLGDKKIVLLLMIHQPWKIVQQHQSLLFIEMICAVPDQFLQYIVDFQSPGSLGNGILQVVDQ